MECPVCFSDTIRRISSSRRHFLRCGFCGFSWADPGGIPGDGDLAGLYASSRRGEPPDVSSVPARIMDRTLPLPGAGLRAVDWGPGADPAGLRLLEERGITVFSWDPFSPGGKVLPRKSFDFGLCLGTAAYFKNPRENFSAFAAALKPGARAFIGTSITPEDDDEFLRRRDAEHTGPIAFYSEKALTLLAASASLSLETLDGTLAVLRRPLPVLVAGGANIDIEGRPAGGLNPRDSNPGRVSFFPGGTGRNIAENLCRLGADVEFVSAVGNDPFGQQLRTSLESSGIGSSGLISLEGETTSVYLSILDKSGDMALALSGMGIFDKLKSSEAGKALERATVSAAEKSARAPGELPFSALVLDGNLLPATALFIREQVPGIPAWLDPVSVAKAERIAAYRGARLLKTLDCVKPNLLEAAVIFNRDTGDVLAQCGTKDDYSVLPLHGPLHLNSVPLVFISLGARGVIKSEKSLVNCCGPYPAAVVSATGAGDAFTAGALWSRLVRGDTHPWDVLTGMACASRALESSGAVPEYTDTPGIEKMVLSRIRNNPESC
ncbi:PfkB family carbohydrate kinase [Breznakiella homolactica]|uniref:Carbohydrate kinase PfkB domain-containing protein n=1 Tax=Breznakiella homolactica TaxID=2798577 RepID=A0A7T7XL78_9SPIR|nr:PfkB family carbohydrate kinase [Breznakiella homolactica]QQO08263.1 hypothetical protein JFL75_15170 [Breznakiella homolactica]